MVWPVDVATATKGPGTFVAVLHQSAPCAPWYTMYAVHEYTPHRRTTQKGPHGHHLQPYQSRVLRYRRHAAHEPAHGVPAHRGGDPRPARARRALWPVHRARRPRDRGHVRALGHRRPGGRARGLRWRRGHRPRARHQRAELSAAGRDHRTHLQAHGGPAGNARLPPRRRVLRAREQRVRRAPVARRRRALPGGRFCRVFARAAAQGDVYHGARGNAAGD